MKRAILSDVHANLEALEAALTVVDELQCDEMICLGDLVGYGPDPAAVIEVMKDRRVTAVRGNHDDAAVSPAGDRSFNPWAREAIRWTRDRLDPGMRAYLKGLPMSLSLGWAFAVHAAPSAPEAWPYVLSLEEAAREFESFTEQICLVGHSHVPMIVEHAHGSSAMLGPHETTLLPGSRYVINVGSVGQPRDGDPRASFGIFDDEDASYTLIRVDYECRRTARKVLEAGLPPVLGERLLVGH